jgi:hypothetical protein
MLSAFYDQCISQMGKVEHLFWSFLTYTQVYKLH